MDRLAPYPTLETLDARFAAVGDELGGAVSVYGESVEGRALRCLEVPALGDASRAVSVCANIHGIEFISAEVALGFARALASPSGMALRHQAQVHVYYCLNPDGRARCAGAGGQGRVRDFRKNARRVDLNRNFPPPGANRGLRLPFTGSDDEDNATYRGSAPLSEPETAHLCQALDTLRPWASINLHSFMGTIIPPRVTTPGDDRTYTTLAQAAFDAQTVRYRRLASYHFDAFTGEQEDHQHHVHKTWAVCLETFPIMASFAQHLRAPSAFWRFNPRDIDRWVANDVPAMFAFFDAALALERPR